MISFFLYHAVALILFLSWYLPVSNPVWQYIDVASFRFFNGLLVDRPFMQIFWALANVKITDLFGALFMAGFSLMYVFDAGKKAAVRRLAQFFYICIWWEIGILILKKVIVRSFEAWGFMRDSPTTLFQDAIRLSEVIPWLKIKDISNSCFPGDHAFIVLQWAGFVSFFCGWRYGLVAYCASVFFVLPRLIGGAHWLSDAVCGSLPLTLIFLAWGTATPLYTYGMKYLEQFSTYLFRLGRSHVSV